MTSFFFPRLSAGYRRFVVEVHIHTSLFKYHFPRGSHPPALEDFSSNISSDDVAFRKGFSSVLFAILFPKYSLC